MLPSKTSNIDLRMSFSEAPDVILCIMAMNSWKLSEPSLSVSNSVIISATTLKLLIVLGLVLTSTDAVSAVLFDPGQQFRETDGLAWRTAYVACTAWALSSAVDIALLVGLLFRETVMRPSIAGYATHLFPYSVAMASSWTPTVTLSTAAMAVSVLDAVMLRASWKLC